MLHDRGERHRQRFGEFADRCLAKGETFDDRAPCRVGEGVENTVKRGLLVKHMLEYEDAAETVK